MSTLFGKGISGMFRCGTQEASGKPLPSSMEKSQGRTGNDGQARGSMGVSSLLVLRFTQEVSSEASVGSSHYELVWSLT